MQAVFVLSIAKCIKSKKNTSLNENLLDMVFGQVVVSGYKNVSKCSMSEI